MSSFFTVPASQRKRKRQDGPNGTDGTKRRSNGPPRSGSKPQAVQPQRNRAARERDDESISGSDSEDEGNGRRGEVEDVASGSESDNAQDTAAERRLKLAERYLENIRAEVEAGEQEVGFDAEDIDRELIEARLKEDVAEEKGRIYRHIAADLDFAQSSHTMFRADTLATTGVAVCAPYVYTVSKDTTLIKWELCSPPSTPSSSHNGKAAAPQRRKPKQLKYTRGDRRRASDHSYQHHTSAILCVAASADGKFVVTGGADRKLIVWDAETLAPLKVFPQHRDAVTSLAFRGKTNQLFSASRDRTIKIWSLNELAYVETLFGHQDEVLDVAAVGGREERCVSVGARDRTARLWKVVEESQLVFRGGGTGPKEKTVRRENGDVTADGPQETPLPRFGEGSLDRVIQLDAHLFVTGSDAGALSLYGLHKKKALHTVVCAHGYDPPPPVEETSAELNPPATTTGPTPRWITALACVPFSDLFVSGSWDGEVRVWRVVEQKRIEAMGVLGKAIGSTHGNGADQVNGDTQSLIAMEGDGAKSAARGIVNDLAVFERGERGKDGLCVVAAMGTETRLGRWANKKGRNGAVVFEVSKKSSSTNGI